MLNVMVAEHNTNDQYATLVRGKWRGGAGQARRGLCRWRRSPGRQV
jgi:hypothetical protein